MPLSLELDFPPIALNGKLDKKNTKDASIQDNEPKAIFDNIPGEKSPNAQSVSLGKDEKEPDLNESDGKFND